MISKKMFSTVQKLSMSTKYPIYFICVKYNNIRKKLKVGTSHINPVTFCASVYLFIL